MFNEWVAFYFLIKQMEQMAHIHVWVSLHPAPRIWNDIWLKRHLKGQQIYSDTFISHTRKVWQQERDETIS